MKWENGIYIIDDRPMELRSKEEIHAEAEKIPLDERKKLDAEIAAWAKEKGIKLTKPTYDE